MSSVEWSNRDVFPRSSFFMDRHYDEPETWFDRNHNSSKIPAINIAETDTAIEVELVVPGRVLEDFDISVSDQVLSIRFEDQTSHEESNKEYSRQEYNYSSFTRSFNLPDNIDSDSVSASCENGLLIITVSKQ